MMEKFEHELISPTLSYCFNWQTLSTLCGSRYLHPLLLLIWIVIGTSLRWTHLAAKPPWTDEFCTLVFSLGNSFQTVPLDQVIALDTLLQPLQPHPNTDVSEVLQHLLTESNHPPLYFVLAHWWMQLWQPDSFGLASIWVARSLSALCGVAAIPAIYVVGKLAFRSRLVGQLCAAIMAVSPYGIFLAQEARHYTLAILWVIASLGWLVVATQHIQHRTSLPFWVGVCWIATNILGIATHYFFALTLGAEALVLLIIRWQQSRIIPATSANTPHFPWWQIYLVAGFTFIGGLLWLPVFLQSNHGGELTEWIQSGDRSVLAWLNPVFQALAAWITMLYLLPVEAPVLPVVIVSGLLMAVLVLWTLPLLIHGIRTNLQQPATRLMTQLFMGVVGSAIAIFFIITYWFDVDLTRGARYNFVYFPAVIVLLGASLAVLWHSCEVKIQKSKLSRRVFRLPPVLLTPQFFKRSGKTAVALIWLAALVSALTVVNNLGYQKYYRPDLLVQLIQQVSHSPVLIATTHKTHVQIGEMMGIARAFKLTNSAATPQFFLAHPDDSDNISTAALQQTLTRLPQPFDLWLVNFYAPLQVENCVAHPLSLPLVDGYNYRLYHCYSSGKTS